MVHFSIFGGHDGRLSTASAIYISVFGGASLRRPPFARQLAATRHQQQRDEEAPFFFFFSLFGGAAVTWPTLAEEYIALREALRGGSMQLADWDRAIGEAGGDVMRSGSFSLFGGVELDATPSEDEELDDLSLQQHSGLISDAAAERLILGIGQGGAQRLAVVRQAAQLSSG